MELGGVNYLGKRILHLSVIEMLDSVTLMTWGLFAFSLIVFYFFGRFTLKLIKQHRNIYSLLHAFEEEEKKKKR